MTLTGDFADAALSTNFSLRQLIPNSGKPECHCRQIQSAQRIQYSAPDLRPVLHPAHLRQVLRAGGAGFFVAAKFKPPKFWMYLAGAIETVLAIGLIFGIYTTLAAAIASIHLLVAAVGVYRVTGKWLWNIGGFEYLPVLGDLLLGGGHARLLHRRHLGLNQNHRLNSRYSKGKSNNG